MKLKLATHVFSESVADSLEFVDHDLNDPKFKGCLSNFEFIRNIVTDLKHNK